MARIKIKDLPKDMKISEEEMKAIMGGCALRLGDPINLHCVGSSFNGLYYLKSVSHSLNTSGYKTKFSTTKFSINR